MNVKETCTVTVWAPPPGKVVRSPEEASMLACVVGSTFHVAFTTDVVLSLQLAVAV